MTGDVDVDTDVSIDVDTDVNIACVRMCVRMCVCVQRKRQRCEGGVSQKRFILAQARLSVLVDLIAARSSETPRPLD